MRVALIIAGVALLWLSQAVGLSLLMSRRGWHPLPWFVISLLLGPATWPLALIVALSGPLPPQLLRRGKKGSGALDILVLFEADHVPAEVEARLSGLMPPHRRLILARVIKAGGPTAIAADAERFLNGITTLPELWDAELQLHFGDMDSAIARIDEQGDVDLLLRSDQFGEQFDGDASRQGLRWIHDDPAA